MSFPLPGVENESLAKFETRACRRWRLLLLYLQERESLLAVSRYLYELSFEDGFVPNASEGYRGRDRSKRPFMTLQELAQSISNQARKGSSQQVIEQYTRSCVEAMRLRLQGLESGNGWSVPEGGEEEVQTAWTNVNLREANLIMDIMLLNIRAYRCIPGSDLFLAWLRLVAQYAFFAAFEPQSKEQIAVISSLQSLTSLTTLALLDISTSLSRLTMTLDRQQSERDPDDSSLYFFDLANVAEINEIMLSLASDCIAQASPAVFAWGMILYTIRELGLSAKEAREGYQVQKVIDQGAAIDPPSGRRLSESSVGSAHQSVHEDVMDHIRAVGAVEDPVEYFIKSAVDGSHVFDFLVRISTISCTGTSRGAYWKQLILQDLISAALDPIGYSPEILNAQVAILSNSEIPESLSSHRRSIGPFDSRADFIRDPFLLESIFHTSLSRFPYETLPFLQICKSLAGAPVFDDEGVHFVVLQLRSVGTFTKATPAGFSAYHTIREDENANLVSLDHSVEMLGYRSRALLEYGSVTEGANEIFHIPAGAVGQVISYTNPPVVMWDHEYSGLSFLGKWLELYHLGQVQASAAFESSDSIASEIISLLAAVMENTYEAVGVQINQERKAHNTRALLDQTSHSLGRDADVISVIFDIFEQQLQGLRFRRTIERPLDIIDACLKFITVLTKVDAGRIWPALARSILFDFKGQDGTLRSIIASLATTSGDFAVLDKCVCLYRALMEAAITGAVPRSPGANSIVPTRPTAVNLVGLPVRVKSEILLAFTQVMVEAYESSPEFKFGSLGQRSRITSSIADAFTNAITYAYGTDEDIDLANSLIPVIVPSATCIIETFCSSISEDSPSTPLLRTLCDGLAIPDSIIAEDEAHCWIDGTTHAIRLSSNLIRARKLLARPIALLESQLLDAFPILVRLALIDRKTQLAALVLMTELLHDVGHRDSSSLLGSLGSESSRSFVNVLATLERPRSDMATAVETWKLLKELVSSRQQWFAIFILTGSSPKQSLKQVTESTEGNPNDDLRGKPFLEIALETLSEIETLDPNYAIALLEFVIEAQENWSWATSSLHSHPRFFSALTTYVGNLDLDGMGQLEQSLSTKIASLVADLSTIYLRYAKSHRDPSIVARMIPAIRWYASHAIECSGYNISLHSNLRKNFSMRYPSCQLSSFKRTPLSPSSYGDEYFYDIALASKLLSFDSSWAGRGNTPNQGFLAEFKRANLNLSLVDSQIKLLHSFKILGIEHSSFFAQDREVQKMMGHVVQNCLNANTRTYPNEKIFENLFQIRIDFAIALTQRLVHMKAKGADFVVLFTAAWDAARFRSSTYESAIANSDLNYYRMVLTMLLLAMQFHVDKRHKSIPLALDEGSHVALLDPSASLVLEIAVSVVAQGFISLASAVHDQAKATATTSTVLLAEEIIGPKDFHLLLSLLQTMLRLPLLDQIISQLSTALSSSGITNSCLLLYSWSHVLTPATTDNGQNSPIYADLSMRFLVSLSSLPLVAGELAVEGVLTRLSTARLTQILQSCPDGVSSIDDRGPQYQILYSVWCSGILPLCANLLHSVGRPMAGEIGSFLNQFARQLNKASNAFSYSGVGRPSKGSGGAMSLALAQESSTLALISYILSEYRAAGASAGVDAMDIPELEGYDQHKNVILQDVEEIVGRSAVLRSRIAATNEKEEQWLREGLLESKIVAEMRMAVTCLKSNEERE